MDDSLKKLSAHQTTLMDMSLCRKTAVTIPLIENEGGYEVLFEVRSESIEQPGDVCFPGGAVEEGETPKEAALREAGEELLISPGQMEIITLLDVMYTSSGLMMYPYAACLTGYEGTFSTDEVGAVFTVPLSFFLENEPDEYTVEAVVDPGEDFPYDLIYGGRDYSWRPRKEKIYFYRYKDRVIWGLTAKMMRAFVKIYKEEALK